MAEVKNNMVLLRGIGLAKKGLGLLGKDKTKAIKAIKPGTKFPGQKTVGQVQSDAAKAKLKMAKDKLEQTFKKTDKSLEKLKKTVKKQKKILED